MKLNIIKYPNPLLREKSKKITRIDDSTKQLVSDMIETLEGYGSEHEMGAALAAIQVGVPLRLTVIREDEGFFALLNPEIVKESKQEIEDIEGCMSVPQKYGKVDRPCKIKVKGLDIDGKKIEIKAEGMMARILLHEIDHMNGIVFLDKVKADSFYKLNKDGQLEKTKEDFRL